jgi:signal peptidase II
MLKNQQRDPELKRGQLATIGVVAFVVALGLDLWTKHWVWTSLRPTGRVVEVWAPHLEFAFAFNRGTAFSVISAVDQPLWFLPITALVVGLSVWIALQTPGVDRLRVLALGLVCGGALGNLHDRLFRADALGQHGVVDFIKLNYPWDGGGSWPSFNIADSALVVGTILLMWSLARAPADPPRT